MASVLIFFSIIFGVCCVLAEKNEFTSITELSPSNSKEDHLQTNIIHTNSSEPILNKSDAEETKKTEKKPRTAIHRDSNFESRDKLILLILRWLLHKLKFLSSSLKKKKFNNNPSTT